MVGKPEKGQLVENMLLQMAHTGQIMSKLGESELINILEKVSQQMQHNTTVKVNSQKEVFSPFLVLINKTHTMTKPLNCILI
jgi:programmed cell death protein 5